jgi:hypothetical protein
MRFEVLVVMKMWSMVLYSMAGFSVENGISSFRKASSFYIQEVHVFVMRLKTVVNKCILFVLILVSLKKLIN